MNMQETIVKESPRRRIARRVGAAGMALAAVLTLGACKATGGGYIDEPLPGGAIPVDSRVEAQLRLQLHLRGGHGQEEAVIKGEITYHDDPSTVVGRVPGDQAPRHRGAHLFMSRVRLRAVTCRRVRGAVEGIPTAQFEGTYRSQDTTLLRSPGRVQRPGVRPG